jgi:hypothetical protein
VKHVRLGSAAGIDELEAFLLRLRLSGRRSARRFAGTFGGWAGGGARFSFGGTRNFRSFRLGRDLRVGVARVRDPDEVSEFAVLEGFKLSNPANT